MAKKDKVICHLTKAEGNRESFYYSDTIKKYFKDEATYNEYVLQTEYHNKVVDMFSTLLGYYDSGQFNTQAMKELSKLRKTYTYVNIYDTFKEFYNKLEVVLKTKTGMNDYTKAKYIFAVINNNINDVCDKNKRLEKAKKIVDKKDIDIDIMNDKKTNTSNVRDISEFLDY